MITRISVRYECSLRWQDFSVSQEFHEYVTRTCNRCGETETRYKQSGTKTTTVTEVWVEWLNIDPFNSPGVADDEHGRDVGAQYDDGIEGFTFRSGSTTKYR